METYMYEQLHTLLNTSNIHIKIMGRGKGAFIKRLKNCLI